MAEGKVAFITGASSGIGLAVAKVLAKAGVKVVLTARREDKLKEGVNAIVSDGGTAAFFKLDAVSDSDHTAAFKFAEDTYGGVDFVFVNAGVEGNFNDKSFVDTTDKDLDFLVGINITGAMRTLRHAVLALKKRGGGGIAFTSSIAAVFASKLFEGNSGTKIAGDAIPYCASKAALDMIARGAAGAYMKDNIRSYHLNVAVYNSELWDRMVDMGSSVEAAASLQPCFPGKLPLLDGSDVGRVILALMDGTSLWKSGQGILIDRDATVDMKYFYDRLEDPNPDHFVGWRSAEELRPFLRDVKGAPYVASCA